MSENVNEQADCVQRWNGTSMEDVPLSEVQTQDQARIEALEAEIKLLKDRMQVLENTFGKWAITHF